MVPITSDLGGYLAFWKPVAIVAVTIGVVVVGLLTALLVVGVMILRRMS